MHINAPFAGVAARPSPTSHQSQHPSIASEDLPLR